MVAKRKIPVHITEPNRKEERERKYITKERKKNEHSIINQNNQTRNRISMYKH
jgi:hypothetical protein